MIKIKTNDGSTTFYSKEYKETYHSRIGAIEESLNKYIKPCKITDGKKILDICFGLGYNTATAMLNHKNLRIVCLEKDKKVLKIIENKLPIPEDLKKEYIIIKKLIKELEYGDSDYSLKLIIGDATETIKNISEKFDAVFLDPFSPPKNPELWTKEFFQEIYKLMKKNAILATYSCAKKVRNNLSETGFIVKDGPKVGRRGPSTIAIKK